MFKQLTSKQTKLIAIILFLILIFNLFYGLSKTSATSDEIVHISAGLSYWKTFDYRANPEHPPLIKLLSSLPLLLFSDIKLPTNDETWQLMAHEGETKRQAMWLFADKFYEENINIIDKILFIARIPIILLSLLLAFYVFKFAKELYGNNAGILALFLYALCPNMLANSQLVTTDLGFACFSFISVYYLWKCLREKEPTTKNALVFGIFAGLAFAAKYTAVFLIIIYTLLFAVFAKKKLMEMMKKNIKPMLYAVIAIIAVVALTYGFINFGYYFKGLKFASMHSSAAHAGYLFGEHSYSGWWYYFIIAFLLKTPIPTIILFILSLFCIFKIGKEKGKKEDGDIFTDSLFLLIPIIIFVLVMTPNHLNIGLRHILQIYPFVFVLASNIINFKHNKKSVLYIVKIPIIFLFAWYAFSFMMIAPHYLSYFNEFAGGPDNGYKYLIDSNIDWGQDYYRLEEYLKTNRIKEVNLAYFGAEKPELKLKSLSIGYKNLQCYPTGDGVYAISASFLQGLTPTAEKCYAWLRDFEPSAKAGYSIFIYKLELKKEDWPKTAISNCKEDCINHCKKKGLKAAQLDYGKGCECGCA